MAYGRSWPMAALLLPAALMPAAGIAQDHNLEQRIDGIVKPYVELGMFNGVVLVAQGDSVQFEKAYGFADYGLSVPLRPNHRFRIASLSKQFTNAAIAVLMDEGLLGPDSRVSEFLPDFPRGDEITVRNLVEHTSGVLHTNDLPELAHRTHIDLDQMIDLLASKGLDFDPGTQERYSNGGYDLLAAIIVRASGSTYEEFLQTRILDPLELKDTGRLHTYEVIPDLATGYVPGRRPATRSLARFYPSELRIGGGSLYSTARDVLVLFRSTFQREFASPETSAFLFWDATKRYEITGRAPGFVAKVFIDIPDDITVVSLANNYSALVSWGRRLYQAVVDDPWQTASLRPVARRIPADRAGFYEGWFESRWDAGSLHVDADGFLIYTDPANDWSVAMIPLPDDRWLHPFFDLICRFEETAGRADRMVCRPTVERLDEETTFVRKPSPAS